MRPGHCSSPASNESLLQDIFQENQRAAHNLLSKLGHTVAGRVYVYTGHAFDWTSKLKGCFNEDAYEWNIYGADLFFARQMIAPSAPWRTWNASHATLFVVPALLGLSAKWDTRWWEMPSISRDAKSDCKPFSYSHALDELMAALHRSVHWQQRKPHLFFSGGWLNMKPSRNPAQQRTRDMIFHQSHVVVAHFERGGPYTANMKTVHYPYVSLCSTASRQAAKTSRAWKTSALFSSTSWLEPLKGQPISFHMRGQIDDRPAYEARAMTCAALQGVVSSGYMICSAVRDNQTLTQLSRQNGSEGVSVHGQPFHVCPATVGSTASHLNGGPCAAAAPRSKASASLQAQQGGRCPGLVSCLTDVSISSYCDELSHSAMSLMVRGDTPSSSRLYDAMDLGILPVTVVPRLRNTNRSPYMHQYQENASLLETMSPLVRWRDFVADATETSIDGIARQLQALLPGAPEASNASTWCELERKRRAMLRWLPFTSWHHDPFTTSMGILAQTSILIDNGVV